MNRSIVRLFGVVILLFTVLVVWTSRWTVFSATALDHNPRNSLAFYASLKVKRGTIYADDGTTVLAKSVKQERRHSGSARLPAGLAVLAGCGLLLPGQLRRRRTRIIQRHPAIRN